MKAMKTLKSLILSSGIGFLCMGSLTTISQPLYAQNSNTNLDDLPDNTQQMRTWGCSNGTATIAVEAKDVNYWQEVVETDGWRCNEQDKLIAEGDMLISCDPYDVIGNLTVVWVKGEQGEEQLQAWMDKLAENPGMVCTIGNEGSWGGLEMPSSPFP